VAALAAEDLATAAIVTPSSDMNSGDVMLSSHTAAYPSFMPRHSPVVSVIFNQVLPSHAST
jgi:hypothetical protein